VARELRRLLLSPERLAAAAGTGAVVLEQAEQHYLSRVLRLRQGDRFAVVDGAGHLWQASLAGDQAQLLQPLDGPWLHEAAPRICLNLAVAMPRRDADVLLRMATELGIDGLQPLQAERSVAERWNRARALAIVREALEQCERLWLPALQDPCSSAALFGAATGLRLFATTREVQPQALTALLPSTLSTGADAVTLAVGPEGGWSPSEEAVAIEQGWQPVSLGPTILRTSTAAVAAAALLASWRAGLSPSLQTALRPSP
jgi:16S rRNA (uracil1498-N3)-methyltransferase